MIIVLKSGISDSDVQDVCQRITEMGYGPHVIRGEFKTIVAAVGEERARLWALLDEYNGWGASIDAYARRRSRQTTVVVLEPRSV